jgi:hypothetical protein
MNWQTLFKSVVDFLQADIVIAVVNFVTIVGFVITVFVFIDVKRIKRYYKFVGRVPDLKKNLKQHATNINNYLNDYSNFGSEIQAEITLAEVTLKSLITKTDGQVKQSIISLLKDIQLFNSTKGDEDLLRKIYLGMIKVEAEIVNVRKDQKWEMSS